MLGILTRAPRVRARLLRGVLAWYCRAGFGGGVRPLSASVYLTNACNLDCSFCYVKQARPAVNTMPRTMFDSVIRDLGGLGVVYLSLTGGEPLLLPDVVERVAQARRAGIPYLHMVSNAELLTVERAQALHAAGLTELSVSLDGWEDGHDRRRGRTGLFAKVWPLLQELHHAVPGLMLVVNSVVMDDNLDELRTLTAAVRAAGLFHKFQPELAWDGSRPAAHDATTAQWRDFSRELAAQPQVLNSRTFLAWLPEFRRTGCVPAVGSSCLYPTHHVKIIETGEVFPCYLGCGGKCRFTYDGDLRRLLDSPAYRATVAGLRVCRACTRQMFVCYLEPRLVFPAGNFLRHALARRSLHP
ncbi:MAG TPA: radical SAM protein [bacterium]|nr:radical SAM protein [bacterium]